MSNELLPEPAVEPLLDDDGHGVLEDLDQGTARSNEKLGCLDKGVPPSVSRSQGTISRVQGGNFGQEV